MKIELELAKITIDDGDIQVSTPYMITGCREIKPRRRRKKKVKVSSLLDELINDLRLDSVMTQ